MVLLYNTIFHREGSSVWYCCITLYFHREGSSVWYCCIILYFIEKAVVCGIVV